MNNKIKKTNLTPIKTDGGFVFDGNSLITPSNEKVMYQNDDVLGLYTESFGDIKPSGDILFVGLGFGLLYNNWKSYNEVNSFTGIEYSKEIIELNKELGNDMEYHCIDAYQYTTDKKYDIICLDIFHKKVKGYEQKQEELINHYKKLLKPNGVLSYLKIHRIDLDHLL